MDLDSFVLGRIHLEFFIKTSTAYVNAESVFGYFLEY